MVVVKSQERFFDFGAQGTFGKAWEIGQKICGLGHCGEKEIEFLILGLGVQQCGNAELGSDNLRWGVYQKRYSHWKLVGGTKKYSGPQKYIREKFYQCLNPQLENQQIWRNVFKSGMAAWKLLTELEKELYNKNAKKYHIHGVNLFLRNWLNSQ